MDPVEIASIIVAGIAAISAFASQKAAAKASEKNTITTSRVDMEKEAYDRARAYDTETIRRQDEEIQELRSENQSLREEVNVLRARVARLEEGGIPLKPLKETTDGRDQEPGAQ